MALPHGFVPFAPHGLAPIDGKGFVFEFTL